jgi:VCBS repeat-containing protein
MVNVNGTNGTNGTNGANPTAGTNGGNANFTQNGLIGADSITVNVKGGRGGKGGNRTSAVGAGATGGNGGNATIAMSGNIFNNPATNNLRVLANATGGDGGLGGTGPTAGIQGNGGNASVMLSGNIVQISKNMNTIELNAHAAAGFGTRYGNATAIVNGNIIQPVKANNVILEAFAETGGPDAPANHGDTNFGTKIATVNGNIVQGNVSNVTVIADAGASNSTANINGNILTLTAASNGLVHLFAQGQQISVTNNKFNLGKQTLELAISEFAPSYNSIVKNNEFNGTGANTFVFSNNAAPAPQLVKDFAVVNLLTETFTFNGDSNILKKFVNATVSGNNVAADITGDNNDNLLNSGDNDDLLTGGKGDDTLDGGAAIDTAVYSGNFAQYAVTFSNVGNLPGTVTDLVPNRDGADTLTNIEFLQFADGTYNVITGIFVPTGGPNTAPVANNDAYAINEDTPLVIAAAGVLGNDTDAEVDPLTAAVVTGPAHGSLTLNPDGSFTYTPNANFFGADSFTYQANDGTANSNTATVNITVNAVNDAPVAVNDSFNTNEDAALIIAAAGVLGNDSDVEADPLTAALVTGPANGSLTLNPDGSFTYTPNADFNGADSFTYQANDGTANSNIATVNITINAVNDAPVLDASKSPVLATIVQDAPAPVGAVGTLVSSLVDFASPSGQVDNVTDPDAGAVLGVAVTGSSANGTLWYTTDNGTTWGMVGPVSDANARLLSADASTRLYFQPNIGFNGTDASAITIRAWDQTSGANGALASAVVNGGTTAFSAVFDTVSIAVTPANTAPVAFNDSFNTNEDAPLVIAAAGVLGNDSDVEADPLTAVLVTGPAHGSLTLNPDGSFTYTPNANFNGADSFTYQANDGLANSAPATVNITVNPVNDAPVANNDSFNTNEDAPLVIAAAGVLTNDTDIDADPLTVVALVTGPANGTVVVNPDGSFTYTPNANFNGVDSFSYQANDGTANSNTATVHITVNPVNDAPVANNDSFNTNEDAPLVVAAAGVLTNDTDIDADPLTVAALVSGPANGSVTLNPDGSFLYTPNANFNGVDSFSYQANDGTANSNIATVNITVNPVNDAPVANNDVFNTNEDAALVIAAPGVLTNDTDIDADPLTVIAMVSSPANGTVVVNPDGSFTYTPNANFNGFDSFNYQAYDGTVNSSTATVHITVIPVNDAPVANNDSFNTNEDAPLVVAAAGVLTNDTDIDVDPLTVVALVSGPANGSLTLNPDGSFLYTPNANFNGVDSFTYQANDGTTNSNIATVTINVAAVNDAPVANTDAYSTNMNTALIVPAATGVLNNDTDIDGDPLQVGILVTGPSNGTLTLNPDGSFTYTPNMGYTGPDSFSYQANDGTANSNIATVNLTVNAGQTFPGTPGDDNLTGGPADDLFYATTGTDTLDGAGHINGDTVDFSNAASGVTANLNPAQQDFTASGLGLTTILNVENLTGSGFDDVLVGDVNRNTLDGGAGNDTLIATAGNDTLTGGVNGASGDTADFSGATLGGVTVDLGAQGAPQPVSAEFGNVTLNGIENVTGTGFTDTLTGDAGNNRLFGEGGDDSLTGGLGNDIIDGGTGIDTAVYSTQPGVANIGWNGSCPSR